MINISNFFALIITGILLGGSSPAYTKNFNFTPGVKTGMLQEQKDSVQIFALISRSDRMQEMDYPAAKELARSALLKSQETDCRSCKVEALTHWGNINWINGDYEVAIEANTKAIELQEGLSDVTGIANNEMALGLIYHYTADYYSATVWYQRAATKFIQANDTVNIQKVYSLFGLLYNQMADYPKSLDYLLKSVQLKSELKEFSGVIYNISGLNEAEDKKYYEKEIEFQKIMLLNAKESGNERLLAKAHHNIATNYYNLSQYEKAIYHHKASIKIKESEGVIPYWNDLGKAYRQAGYPDSAIYAHTKSLGVVIIRGTRISKANTYIRLGNSFYENNRLGNAITAFNKGLELELAMGNRQSIANIYISLAKVFLQLGKYSEAKDYANQGMVLAKEIGAGNTVRLALDELSRISAKAGDYEEAYDYQQQYQELNNRIASAKAQYELAKAGMQYDLDKKNIELSKLAVQNQANNAELEKERIVRYSINGALILLLMIGFLVFTLLQKEKKTGKVLAEQKEEISKQNDQLLISNKEKELLLAEVHHRVKNNLQVVSSLLSIQAMQLSDENAINAVKEGQARVQAMGMIHEDLYQQHDFNGINMPAYCRHLAENLISSFGFDLSKFSLVIDVEDITLDLDTAIPLGLIGNELITNALKYAYKDVASPFLRIHLYENPGGLCLEIIDNGNGIDKINGENSFGLELVKELASNLDGTTKFIQGEGLKVCIIVKKYKMTA